MAGEIDTISVRLDADIRNFQHQLDRARAELSKFAAGASPAVAATAGLGRAATRTIPGLGRLGNALENVATRAAGMPGILGKVLDVFGSFAIGGGPMVAVFAGMAGIALAFNKITESARETRKAADDAVKSITNAWLSKQTQGDIDLINEQAAIGSQLDAQAAKVRRAQNARENKEYLAKLNAELTELQEAYNRATLLLTERRNERQREEAERTARAEKKAADESRKAWQEANEAAEERIRLLRRLQNLERTWRSFSIRVPTSGGPVTSPGGVTRFPDGRVIVGGNLPREMSQVPGSNIMGKISAFLGKNLDPKLILSNFAGGILSSIASNALPAIGEFAKQILGLGDAASRAAAATRKAINDLRDSITLVSGSDLEQNIVRLRQDLTQRVTDQLAIFGAGMSGRDRAALLGGVRVGDLRGADSLGEFENIIRGWRDMFAQGSTQWEYFNQLIEYAGTIWEDFNKQVRGITDSLRNVPAGFKIALAQFNATAVAPASVSPLVDRYGIDVRVRFDPAGIFKEVETQAVLKKRSGGVPAWEL